MDLDRAWTMFLYASEDYQKALKALESAEQAMKRARAELDKVMESQVQELITD